MNKEGEKDARPFLSSIHDSCHLPLVNSSRFFDHGERRWRQKFFYPIGGHDRWSLTLISFVFIFATFIAQGKRSICGLEMGV